MSYEHDTISPPRRSDAGKVIGLVLSLLGAVVMVGGIVYGAGADRVSRQEFEAVKGNVQEIKIQQVEQSGTLRVMETKIDVTAKIDALEKTLRDRDRADPLGRRGPR